MYLCVYFIIKIWKIFKMEKSLFIYLLNVFIHAFTMYIFIYLKTCLFLFYLFIIF